MTFGAININEVSTGFEAMMFLTMVKFHKDQGDSSSGWSEGRGKKLRRYSDHDYRLIMILCCHTVAFFFIHD